MFWYILAGLPILLLLRRILRKRTLGSLSNKPSQEPPIVATKNGQVSGEWLRSSKGRPYASFKGIPYAKPPVGNLRFMRPEPVDNWTGVKKCTKSAEFCQINVFQSGNPRTGQEDALVLNVNSPNIQGKLPVMVFIHGGAFSSGSCSTKLYGAEYFMNKDVVLVAINYRLAVLGFLYLDGEKVCGNQGMRDQVLAMRWVKDNIESFGGDNNNITIFGESAGGMSVMNHIVSPMSAGLFNAAIVQSGSPKSPYCCLNKHPAYYAYKIAEHLGIDRNLPVEQIIEKLQKMNPFEIQEKVGVLEEFVRAPVYCKPILDGGLVEDPFMPEEPMELIKKGKFNKVPVIMGANEHEGLLIKAFYEKDGVKFEEAWNKFETIGPLAFFATEKSEVVEEEVKLCLEYRNKHFANNVFCSDKQSTDKFIQMYGDFLFVAPCYLVACEMSQHVPVFLYSYNFPGTLSLYPVVALTPAKLGLHFFLKFTFGLDIMTSSSGVCHGDELFVMFKPSMIPTQYITSPVEQSVSEELVEMWSSFATHKNPTPSNKKWKEFNVEDSEYFEISAKSGMLRNSDYIERMQEWKVMWQKIPTTFRRYSSPTWSQFPGDRYPIPGAESNEDIKIDTIHEEEIIEDKKDSSSSNSSSSSSEDENEPEEVETAQDIELEAGVENDSSAEEKEEIVECYLNEENLTESRIETAGTATSSSSSSSSSSEDENEPEEVELAQDIELEAGVEKNCSAEEKEEIVECYLNEENLTESSETGEMKIESSLTVESISVSSVTTESIVESSITRENLMESRIETAGTATSSSSSSSGDNGSIEIVDREEVVHVISQDVESDSEC